tara:strand:+ start:6601 stop:7908 length:1308 start_codon:yes stop_codon:yes gene_type:complete
VEIHAGPEPQLRINGHPIHSTRAPAREALRFLQRLNHLASNSSTSDSAEQSSRKPDAVLVCGLGLGFLLDALESAELSPFLESGIALYLFEPCPDLRQRFQELRIQERIDTLCSHPSIHYLSEGNWNNPPSRLEVRIFPSYLRYFPHLADAFRPDRNQNTLNRLMRTWKRNYTIRTGFHAQDFLRMPSNTSFVFLGASPTLERFTLDELRNLRSRYLLLCSDTSLGFCLSQGLMPDLMLSVDPSPATGYHLVQAMQCDKAGEARVLPHEVPVLTFSAGPRYHHCLGFSEILYESDFPPESETDPTSWQSISNPVGNLAGLAIALAGSGQNNDLLLLGSDGRSSELQSHCRSTGYEYFARRNQNRLSSLDTYFYRLARGSYNERDRQDMIQRMQKAASERKLELNLEMDAAWQKRLAERSEAALPMTRSQSLSPMS